MKIGPERQAAFYIGRVLTVIGFIVFGSVFVSFAMHFGEFDPGPGFGGSLIFRSVGGMALIVVGGTISGIGAKGLAGSGTVLDPEQAREDLKPYSEMVGGIVKDAVEEFKGDEARGEKKRAEKIMVRCTGCKALNEETAKFCNQCGAKV